MTDRKRVYQLAVAVTKATSDPRSATRVRAHGVMGSLAQYCKSMLENGDTAVKENARVILLAMIKGADGLAPRLVKAVPALADAMAAQKRTKPDSWDLLVTKLEAGVTDNAGEQRTAHKDALAYVLERRP